MTLINYWMIGFVGVSTFIVIAIGFALVVSRLLSFVSANFV
jgi:hypothetical protein